MAFRGRYRKYYKRRGLRRGALRSGLRRKKVSKSVKRYVKRTIHRQIENKEFLDYFSNMTIQTLSSGTNVGNNCRNLLPLPAQGTNTHQRVGSAIKVVRGVIKGHINIKPYDAATNPQGTPLLGKIWIFRDLAVTQMQPIQGGSYTTYFDNFFRGNGTSLPFQGTPLDIDLPINDDLFRVVATKTFKIGASNATATGQVGSGGYFDNSPMSIPFYFNWGKYCKKVIKFNDGGSYPQNANLYIVCQVVRADGASSGSYQMAEWHMVNHSKYEDA